MTWPQFSSALVLAMIALLIGYESIARLIHPVPIAFNEAIPLAAVGLVVNLLSAWLLHDDRDHVHEHDRHHDQAHPATLDQRTTICVPLDVAMPRFQCSF